MKTIRIFRNTVLMTVIMAMWSVIAFAAEGKTIQLPMSETTKIHAGQPDAVLYDASATKWTCTQATVAGGKFNDSQSQYGGSYIVLSKFDVSSLPSDVTVTEVTLDFTSKCTVSGKNSMLETSRIGIGWDAASATWNNTNVASIINAQPTLSGPYVATSSVKVSIDVTSQLTDLSASLGQVAFAIYTYTAREQEVSDLKLTVKYLEAGYSQTTATLLHTASVQGGSNEAAVYIDQETHYYNNWGTSAWVAQAYAEFDFSNVPDGQKVTSAEFTVFVNCAKGTRTFDINYLDAGTEIDYQNLQLCGVTGTQVATFSDITTSYAAKKVDVTDVINTFLNAGKKRIIFIMSNGAAGGNIYGKGSATYAPTLKMVTTGDRTTSYTVRFVDTEGKELKSPVVHEGVIVGHKVSASGNDLAPIDYNGTRYLYSSGNNAIVLSENPSENIITLVFEKGEDRLPAFPEAKGWGRYAEGGRYGKVYHVTNLNDSGAGSLRDAVSSPNRIVVFDVAGVIRITDRMVFSKNLYVAGQTAPGEGITVYGDGVSFSGSDNIIVRYMRFRMGAVGTKDKDCAGIARGTNMIFDHCSFSWGLDETFSINSDGSGEMHSFTLSNCIFGQGLMSHSAGGLMQGDSITLYRNFYCDNNTRNNKVKGRNQYVNNVVYNWNNGAYIMGGDSEGQSYCNIVGNLFINGPAGGGNAFSTGNGNFHCYVNDNIQDSNRDGKLNPSAVTNFAGSDVVASPYPYPALEAWKANSLIDNLIPTVGASLPYRDLADCYMVDELMSFGTEGALIANEKNLFIGAPDTWTMWQGKARTDSDGDGMPDEWETKNGTDPTKDDAMNVSANGYVNIENYINSITADDRDFFLRAPMRLEQTGSSNTTITLRWRDYTYDEDGFAIEVNGKEVARTEANQTTFDVTGLAPDASYNIRIRAFKGNEYSEYSNSGTFRTKPLNTTIIDIDNFNADAQWTKSVETWNVGSTGWAGTDTYKDGQNVLFENAIPDETANVSINETVTPGAVVVKGDGNFAFTGTGSIAGDTTSVNKGGNGTLVLNTLNTYRGATVMHGGTIEFNSLKNGGEASAIGASSEFAQNWIMDGGTYRYTGGTTTTNRSAKLTKDSRLSIVKGATVTMSGSIESDTCDFILAGEGQINVASTNFFDYTGATVLEGSTLYLTTPELANIGIGNSSRLVFAGGTLRTAGESANYETYAFPIEVREGTTSYFSPNRNCYIDSKVSGSGTLQINIPYVREYIEGDWTGFTGRVIANAGASGNLFLLNKNKSIPNGVVVLKNGAVCVGWDTNGVYSLGGLSGDTGTELRGSSKQTNGFTASWTVGSANTDETFKGIINDYSCSGSGHTGTTSITKVGSGVWRLTGANQYSGNTLVKEGTLIVNGTHSGKGLVSVTNGATLAGKGTIPGNTTISTGSTVYAGDTLINGSKLTFTGKLTVNNSNVTIPVSYNDGFVRQNKLTLTGGATFTNATLNIELADDSEPLTPGTSFGIFVLGTTKPTGTIKTITPTEYIWDTSALFTNGIIKVAGLRGDANGDGTVDVSDITATAAYILGQASDEFNEVNADANQDGTIDVADITAIASMILN